LLQLKGVAVTVYERDAGATARLSGGTLDLHRKTGQRTLKKAGLLAPFLTHSRPVGMKMGDKQGRVLFQMNADKSKPEIERPVLRQLLLDSLAAGTVVWDRQVVALDQQDGAYALRFQNGESAAADFVIIADGVQSKARGLVFGTLAEETGTFVIQGEIDDYATTCPTLSQLTGLDNLAVVEDKKTLFLHQRADGSVCLYASFRKTEPWLCESPLDFGNAAAMRAFLHRLFAQHAAVYHELFDAVSTYSGFPLRVFPAEEIQQPHANLTLIGDAAHAMPPFGGLGVNLGLVDALTLTQNLTSGKFASLPAALADYERQMVAYAAPVQQGTHAADDRVHTQYANVVQRLKKTKLLEVGRIVQYLALLLVLLVSGLCWGNWLVVGQYKQVFPASAVSACAQFVLQLAGELRFLAAACLLLLAASAYFMALARPVSRAFFGTLTAIGLMVLLLVITVVVDIPFANQVVSWPPATLPFDWEALRNQWQLYNSIRLVAALVSLGLFAAAVLRPFEKQRPG